MRSFLYMYLLLGAHLIFSGKTGAVKLFQQTFTICFSRSFLSSLDACVCCCDFCLFALLSSRCFLFALRSFHFFFRFVSCDIFFFLLLRPLQRMAFVIVTLVLGLERLVTVHLHSPTPTAQKCPVAQEQPRPEPRSSCSAAGALGRTSTT